MGGGMEKKKGGKTPQKRSNPRSERFRVLKGFSGKMGPPC